MSKPEFDLLTPLEKAALQEPALRSRARAVQALSQLAASIGLGQAETDAVATVIRSMDKAEARRSHQAMEVVNQLFGRVALTAAERSEPVLIEPVSPKPIEDAAQPLETAPPFVDFPSQPTMELEVDRVLESLETTDERGQAVEYDIGKTERFLNQLNIIGPVATLTAADFDNEVFRQLALMYKSAARKAAPESVDTNIACTWGYLAGVDMTELIMMRAKIKPDAKAADVHNSRAAFVSGAVRAWQNGARLELQPAAEPAATWSDQSVESEPSQALASVPEPVAAVRSAIVERSLDDEPAYERLAVNFVESALISSGYQAALRSLLDPSNKGQMTEAKQSVINQLRQQIEIKFGSDDAINQLEAAPVGRVAVRRLLGLFNKHGRAELREPVPVRDQLSGKTESEKQVYLTNFYQALEALLGLLADEAGEVRPVSITQSREVEATPSVLQVRLDGGQPRLELEG